MDNCYFCGEKSSLDYELNCGVCKECYEEIDKNFEKVWNNHAKNRRV